MLSIFSMVIEHRTIFKKKKYIYFSLISLKEITTYRILTSFGLTARAELHNFILYNMKKENVFGT